MSENVRAALVRYLAEAHAMERQSLELLDGAVAAITDRPLRALFERHREETRRHARAVAERLAAHDGTGSAVKELGLRAGGRLMSAAADVATDTLIRFATETLALESLEIAAYGVICRLAALAGDTATIEAVTAILEEEETMSEQLAGSLDRIVDLSVAS